MQAHLARAREVAFIGGTTSTPHLALARLRLDSVDNRAEIREFLTTRRARMAVRRAARTLNSAPVAVSGPGSRRPAAHAAALT